MSTCQEVLLYEELSMNAHPALKTQLYDGWVLRFSNSYTRRANSVNPIYPALLPVGEKIEHCEKMYSSQKLPVTFKLTHELSGALDEELEIRGYKRIVPTNIMTLEIGDMSYKSPDFDVSDRVTNQWAECCLSLNERPDNENRKTARLMLDNIQNTTLCGRIIKDNETVACGLCVVERGYAGLFVIVVHSRYRGRGFGYELCASLLYEAGKHQASAAYLQVEQANSTAISLYEKLGFTKLYDYWYRVKRG